MRITEGNSLIVRLVVVWIVGFVRGDLIVNVRNQGGESYKQTIRANLTDETVRLSFKSYDGSSTVMVVDFRNEIQLVHTIRLGDQEENLVLFDGDNSVGNGIGQFGVDGGSSHHGGGSGGKMKKGGGGGRLMQAPAVYKSYCFVTKFKAQEFIPVDAMAKLRQKNPWSLRTPERNEPSQNITFDILLDPTASDWISPAIKEECGSSQDGSFVTSTYAVKMEISERAVNPEDYLRAVRDIVVEDDGRGCGGSSGGIGRACVCTASVCVGWYPCSLKFCRARSSSSNTTSLQSGGNSNNNLNSSPSSSSDNNFKTYRCGIHTCRICRNYIFGVTSGVECV